MFGSKFKSIIIYDIFDINNRIVFRKWYPVAKSAALSLSFKETFFFRKRWNFQLQNGKTVKR